MKNEFINTLFNKIGFLHLFPTSFNKAGVTTVLSSNIFKSVRFA